MTVPRATYRLQLRAGFGFGEAGAITDYLADLGVSHMYSSPQLQAAPSSAHGYDVADPSRLSDELGGPRAHAAMLDSLRTTGLGMVLDIVPNHMVVSTPLNRWWWDTLRFGRASPWSKYFDIDWEAPHAAGRLLLPVLGDKPEAVRGRGEFGLVRSGPHVHLTYFDHVFPLGPAAVAELLRASGSAFEGARQRAEGLARAASIDPSERDAADAALDSLLGDPELAALLDATLQRAADPARLAPVLESQRYRLKWWRDEMGRNYRRFFEVDSLAALRIEDEEVFEAVHAIPIAAAATGAADGLRIDHPDGLRDPAGYLERLRTRLPDSWLIIEKILEPGEEARTGWPVDGLTGYSFLDSVQNLLVDPAAEAALSDIWRQFDREAPRWTEMLHACKRLALQSMFAVEVRQLVRLLGRCDRVARSAEDSERLRSAIEEIICHFHIYRTYIRPPAPPLPEDAPFIREACSAAGALRPDLAERIDSIGGLMLGAAPSDDAVEFIVRFQQLCGAVMAKGAEDTAFYRHLRLVALNEVGGNPSQFGLSLEAFHGQMVSRSRSWPNSMLSTSTHDTKRSEDVRARLIVLAEIPDQWRTAVLRWHKTESARQAGAPIEPRDEYLIYQTLVGAWPIDADRLRTFMRKAMREAKLRTSWTDPDTEYEAAVDAFIDSLFTSESLLPDIVELVDRVTLAGYANSLAQTLLKLTCPGVPDIYQGCELWDLSLVDPDNRRPVDFEKRRAMLAELDDLSPERIWRRAAEDLPKLWTTRQALALRARRPDALCGSAGYDPITARGMQADCCIAFARAGDIIAVVSRFPIRLEQGWGDTTLELPAGRWFDHLAGLRHDGGPTEVRHLLRMAPVALLEREEA